MDLLYILFALDMLNMAVFLPVFGACARSLGGTPFTIGLINSSSALISLFWNPIVGSLSDQVGRKGLLVNCLVASALGSFIMAISPSLLLFSIGKLVGSLGSPVAILLRSVVADKYKTPDEKKNFFNKCGPFMSVAFLVGSLSSGFLSEAKNGYSLAFLLMSCIMGVSIIITKRTLSNDTKSKGDKKENSSFTSTAAKRFKSAILDLRTISWPRYKNLFYFKGLYDFSLGMIFSNIGLILLDEFDVKGRNIGYVFMMISICRIITTILKLKLTNVISKIPDNVRILGGAVVLFVCYLVIGLSSSLGIFLLFVAIMVASRTFTDTTLTEIISIRTTQNDRGKVIGAFENLLSFAMFVAPLLSGVLAEAFGQRLLMGSAAIPIGIAVLIILGESQKTD